MNERIRELAEQQAGSILMDLVMPDAGMPERIKWNIGCTTEHLEKFAELIVKECMDCSTWVGKMNSNPVEPIHTAHAINNRIKKRFGVEE